MTTHNQLFGYVEVEGVHWDAMLCRDTDDPDLIMVHWFGRNAPAFGAALFRIRASSGEAFEGNILALWDTAENGALIAAGEEKWSRARFLTIHFNESANGIQGSWNISESPEASGKLVLFKSLVPEQNFEIKICDSWESFRLWAAGLQRHSTPPIFRGHGSSKWRLETSSFRAGQTRLDRFYSETLLNFKSHAEALLDREFDLNKGSDYSTLLGLAQHHGLPTPLLDFTDSPYIAAYFAFSDALDNDRRDDEFVRVYSLSGEYLKHSSPLNIILAPVYHT